MICPKCHKNTLRELLINNTNVKVDRCSRCNGIWFDGVELEATIPEATKQLAVANTKIASARLCPRCYKVLTQFECPQTLVKIDMCELCDGAWIEARELEEIEMICGGVGNQGVVGEPAYVNEFKGAFLHFIRETVSEISPLDQSRSR